MRIMTILSNRKKFLTGIVLFVVGVLLLYAYFKKSGTIVTAVIAILGCAPLIYSLIPQKKIDALSPLILLPFTFMLYALGPLNVSSKFSQEVVVRYLFIQLLGLVALYAGLIAGAGWKFNYDSSPSAYEPEPQEKSRLLFTVIGMLLLASISLATYFHAFGGLSGYIKTGYGGQYYLIIRKAFLFGAGFEWLLLGAGLLIFYGLRYRFRLIALGGVILFAAVATIILMTGRRHQLFFPLIYCVILIHYAYRKIPSLLIAAGLLFGISFAQYFALARYYLPKGVVYAIKQVWPAVVKNPILIAPWAANEFRWPAASLLEVLQYGGPTIMGRSYVAFFGMFLPFLARFFTEISFDVNRYRLETFYPDLWATGRGLGFSPVTEGYMNFGLPGVFLHLFLYGYIIGKIYNRTRKRPSVFNLLLLAGSLPVFFLYGFRVPSASFAYSWMRIYLVPWILLVVISGFEKAKPMLERLKSRRSKGRKLL